MCNIGTYIPSMNYSKSSLGTFIEFEPFNLFYRNLAKKKRKVSGENILPHAVDLCQRKLKIGFDINNAI